MKRLIFLLLMFFTTRMFSQIPVGNISVINGEYNNPEYLFDSDTKTGWFAGWNAAQYPAQLLIDFGKEVEINKVRYFDGNGSTNLSLLQFNETQKNFVLLQKFRLDKYQTWVSNSFVTIKTRYIVVQYEDIQGDLPITEIQFYYDKADEVQPPKKLSGDALKLGTNGFHWVPTNLIPTRNIRVYQMTEWTYTPEGIAVEPSKGANANYDTYYKQCKSLGINVVPCINKLPLELKKSSSGEWADGKFNAPNSDPTRPESYRTISEYGWQLSARYGNKVHPISDLKVNQIPRWNGDVLNQPLSGLDLLKYIELENEPDRPWKTAEFKYTPEEFAAFVSAVADGHEGTMGKGYGIMNASDIKVVVAGISSINAGYIDGMNKWMIKNRPSHKWPKNVVFQVHHYCNKKNPFPGPDIDLFQGYGIDPERDKLTIRLKTFVQYIRQNIGDNEIWFGEFGYDTQPCSTALCQYPDTSVHYSAQILQSEWNMRCHLIALECGIAKTFVYNLSDEPSAQMGYCFGSSGQLESEPAEFKKKEAWRGLNWLVNQLDGYTFNKRILTKDNMTILEFRSGLFKSKYFYWKHTDDGKGPLQFSLNRTNYYADYKIKSATVNRNIFNSKTKVK